MSNIENLSPNVVKPLTLLSKTNEIIDALNDGLNSSYSEQNPLLVSQGGACTWTVTHNLGTEEVSCTLYEGDSEVLASIDIISENTVSVRINSSANINANTYSIIVLAKGAASDSSGSGSGGGSITVDSELSEDSENPVQNKILYPCLSKFISSQEVIEASQDRYELEGLFNYLNSNSLFSDGPVQIKFNSGYYEAPGGFLTFHVSNPNLNFKFIIGSGANVYSNNTYNNTDCFNITSGTDVEFYFESTGVISGKSESSAIKSTYGTVRITGESHFTNSKYALRAVDAGIIIADQYINIHDCDTAFFADGGTIIIKNDAPWASPRSLYNLEKGFEVAYGGVIKCKAEFSVNNVTTWTSQAIGTYTADGAIIGVQTVE